MKAPSTLNLPLPLHLPSLSSLQSSTAPNWLQNPSKLLPLTGSQLTINQTTMTPNVNNCLFKEAHDFILQGVLYGRVGWRIVSRILGQGF
jgi:hypothetical protein